MPLRELRANCLGRRSTRGGPPIEYCHVVADYHVTDRALLERADPLRQLLVEAAEAAGMTVLASPCHQFEPSGATVVLLLAQSHLAIHTWVEKGLACVDLMTCGDTDPEAVLSAIRQALPGQQQLVSVEERTLQRM